MEYIPVIIILLLFFLLSMFRGKEEKKEEKKKPPLTPARKKVEVEVEMPTEVLHNWYDDVVIPKKKTRIRKILANQSSKKDLIIIQALLNNLAD